MKLIRYRENQKEKPGVFMNDKFYDTSAFGEDYNETLQPSNFSTLQQFNTAPGLS